MSADDLDVPLGKDGDKRRGLKLPIAAPQLIAGLLGISVIIVGLWTMLADDPFGGEPIVVVTTHPPAKSEPAAVPPGSGQPRDDGVPPVNAAIIKSAEPAASAPPPGSKTITIIDGSSGKKQDVVIPGKSGSLPNANSPTGAQKASPDARLLEQSRHGAIPKIGPDGTRPSAAYARPIKFAADKAGAPRIAIIVGGLGISASATAEALAKLPAPITLAFAPYGAGVDSLAAQARADDHEVLLQAPMEPFDYPDNDPGPQTLLTTLTGDQNVDRLQWLMSRMQGYVGVTNYMGARFTASEQALAPVLRETAKRGLIFVDDSSSARSVAGQVAGSNNLPFAKADIVLDTVPTPVEIDRALTRLEMLARDKGSAVGYASALPGTVARIAAWAKNLQSRGFELVPITTIALKTKSS